MDKAAEQVQLRAERTLATGYDPVEVVTWRGFTHGLHSTYQVNVVRLARTIGAKSQRRQLPRSLQGPGGLVAVRLPCLIWSSPAVARPVSCPAIARPTARRAYSLALRTGACRRRYLWTRLLCTPPRGLAPGQRCERPSRGLQVASASADRLNVPAGPVLVLLGPFAGRLSRRARPADSDPCCDRRTLDRCLTAYLGQVRGLALSTQAEQCQVALDLLDSVKPYRNPDAL